jgi:hypothetical protein
MLCQRPGRLRFLSVQAHCPTTHVIKSWAGLLAERREAVQRSVNRSLGWTRLVRCRRTPDYWVQACRNSKTLEYSDTN